MNKSDIAIELFEEGYNCAQAVLSAFDDEVGLDRDTAIKISCEHGAGMAEDGVCGAVVGALMVLDFKFKQNSNIDTFNEKFKNMNASIICKELINYDLTTEDGFQNALDNNIFSSKCPKFVKDSVHIIEEILKIGAV